MNLEKLAHLFDKMGRFTLQPSQVMHMCIDPQRNFTQTEEENLAIENVTEKIIPSLRIMGIKTIWVYFANMGINGKPNELDKSYGGFHPLVKPDLNDVVIPKTHVSAFKESNIRGMFKQSDIKLLLVSGVAFEACVADTVVGAKYTGRTVVLLKDGTDYQTDDNFTLNHIQQSGACITSFDDLLPYLSNKNFG